MSDREPFSSYVRSFLIDNRLFFEKGPFKGEPCIGRLTAKVIDELYDRYSEKAQAWEKAQRAARRAPKKPKEFEQIPPQEEDVRRYCREIGYNFSIDEFFGHYGGNGWKVGANAMVSWKSCCRTFQARTKKPKSEPIANGAVRSSIYAEPEWDWRAAVSLKWPIEEFPSRERWELGDWADFPLDYRKIILAEGPPK